MESDQETTVITAYDNGPYVVQGEVKVVDAEGNEWTSSGPNVALCRCGASSNKPFCDGTHSSVGFAAADRATAE